MKTTSIRQRAALWAMGGLGALAAGAEPAWAHHPMGGKLPGTLAEGILSGLGHPILGIDHLAALIAVGGLAALHAASGRLVLGYVLAMLAGAAVHVQGATLPAADALVALSVVALGAVLVLNRRTPAAAALALFAVTSLLHGYALGESIVGAEPTPLLAYFIGLAVVQTAIGLGAMFAARLLADPVARGFSPARLAGLSVICVGLVSLAAQIVSG